MLDSLFDPRVRGGILERVASMSHDSPRQWGRLTPHQAICHLADAFEWSLGQRDASGEVGASGPAWLMKWFALRLPIPWPKGVPTLPAFDLAAKGDPPAEFLTDRDRLASLIEEFGARPPDFVFPPHPIFKTMGRGDWGRWGYRHSDHHLRQFGC